jgi:nicotinamide phosphoribosyltransferase
MREFGFTVNEKGYRVLPDYIRVIQGDGVSRYTIEAILEALKMRKISADNITFGMGGELLQKVNRDTMKFAMKASAAEVEGLWIDVYKDPVTDHGKKSKRGRLAVVKDVDNGFKTIREDELKNRENLLRSVFRNGKLLIDETFEQVRSRSL